MALESSAFAHDRLDRRSFTRFIGSATARLIVVEVDQTIGGYALVLFRRRSRIARLYSLAVGKRNRRRGLGSMLLKAAEDVARARGAETLRLEVDTGNARAMRLYRGAGYVVVGKLPRYYEDGKSAYKLKKHLVERS